MLINVRLIAFTNHYEFTFFQAKVSKAIIICKSKIRCHIFDLAVSHQRIFRSIVICCLVMFLPLASSEVSLRTRRMKKQISENRFKIYWIKI